MKINFRSILVCSVLSIVASTTAFSQELEYAYRDGYEDGYDDAMDDCPCPPRFYSGLGNGFYLGLGAGYEGYQIQRSPMVWDEGVGSLNTHANGWTSRLMGGGGR